MANETSNGRQQRGLELAATKRITKAGTTWVVPSQSSNSRYTVSRGATGYRCTCPDFELRGETCKHGYAVEFFLKRETAPDGTVTETRAVRVTYSQDWAAYNRAQTTEKDSFCALLRDLVASVPTPTQTTGRPSLPMPEKLFAAAFKVYSTVSGRRFMTDLRGAVADGYVAHPPHYNSVFNVIEDDATTAVLQDLIARSAQPLQAVETSFAVDSTGFGTTRFYRHFTSKYGGKEQVSRDYVKVHAMVGVKTGVVTAVEVSDRDAHDGPMLPGLVAATATTFKIDKVSADKAYSSRKNLATIEGVGAMPLVPFTSRAVGNSDSPMWNRLFHFFSLHRDEFLAAYHCRSNAESTFSAIKRKFGESIRSKTPVAQTNEALLKVLCHNIVCLIHEMHESGVPATFPVC